MNTPWRTACAIGITTGALMIPAAPSEAASERVAGHVQMSWTVTDAAGQPPPDAFGAGGEEGDGGSGEPWAGSDRIWTQSGFSGSYRIVVDGQNVAGYCGDFHNAKNPDAASTWVEDPSAFAGSDKALTKLSYVQWRWGSTTDPDLAAAINLYTHFLGSPDDRSNGRGVPIPDINDNDILDEIVTIGAPHEAVGRLMSVMDGAAEGWSAAFGHSTAQLEQGITISLVAGDVVVSSVATGFTLPPGSFDVRRDATGSSATTAGAARPLRDVTSGSQNSVTAGAPQSAMLPLAAEVHLRKTVSSTGQPDWVNGQTGTTPSHQVAPAPKDPALGSFDDAPPTAGDALPVYTAGDRISFRYEVWLDPSATGGVIWSGGTAGIVADDGGTPDDTDDDFAPDYVEGDDGDGILEVAETWVYGATDHHVASAGTSYRNVASIGPGTVVDIGTGTSTAASTTPRRDPAGYVVPCLTTSAVDAADDDGSIGPTGGVINDRVTYCNLVPGQEYVVEGVVVARVTGKPTRHRGATTFTPDAPDGEVLVEIEITPDEPDVEHGVGHGADPGSYVVFETLSTTGAGAVVVLRHDDLDDVAQTFTVRRPLAVDTVACENALTVDAPDALGKVCDRVLVSGDPGDVVDVTVTPIPVVDDVRVCDAPGVATTARLTLDDDGTATWQTEPVEVAVGTWEFIEIVVPVGPNDDRRAGRDCATAPREPAETVLVVAAPPPPPTTTPVTTPSTTTPVPAPPSIDGPPSRPELPRTGDSFRWLQQLGSLLLLAGVAVVVAVGWNLPLIETRDPRK